MKRRVVIALMVCMLAAPALPAAAQYDDEPVPKIGIKIGAFAPLGSEARENGKNLWRSLGAEYTLKADAIGRPTTLISGQALSTDNSKFEASMLGLQYEMRWYANPDSAGGLYYGAGVGYNLLKARVRDVTWESWSESSGGKLGMSAVAGYQFAEALSGELRYNHAEKMGGIDFNGVSLNLTVRMEY